MTVYDFPKVDLHLHIDGSIPFPTAYRLAKERNLFSGDYQAFQKTMMVKEDCHSLSDYLSCFDVPLAILQDRQALFEATYDLIGSLEKQQLIYVELRFAPQFHTRKGLSQEEALQAVLMAVDLARDSFPSIHIRIILCMMTLGKPSLNHEANMETIKLAQAYRKRGVCALDMAGAEGIVPFDSFLYLYEEAHKLEIPYTIHAGESGGPEHIDLALSNGASRIGHGRSAVYSHETMKELERSHVLLELCPTSNLHCEVVPSYRQHPIRQLYDAGILVSVNTDNMSISNTTLDKEYEMLETWLNFKREDFIAMNRNALKSSFLPFREKEFLLEKFQNRLESQSKHSPDKKIPAR